MKANVEFPKRTKNSFIYFQVGLIATMFIVLLVLEFNFKNVSKPIDGIASSDIFNEPTYYYNPAPQTKKVEIAKPEVTKVVKVTHEFEATKEEPIKNEVELAVENQDNSNENQNNTTALSTETPKEVEGGEKIAEPTVFSVEELPMFPACKGLSRAEQKACFDEQLAKAIVKHLVYPEEDLEDGKQGVAQVEFVIDENGMISNVVALNNKRASFEMQKAAEKAVRKLPKLIPAKQGKKSVRIKYSVPVVFKIR